MESLTMDMSLSKLREIVKDRKVWCAAVHGVRKSWTGLSEWTKQQLKKELVIKIKVYIYVGALGIYANLESESEE